MGMTMSEKILAHAAGLTQVEAGQIVMAKVDKAMMDDLLGPRVEIAEQMERIGAKIWMQIKWSLFLTIIRRRPMPHRPTL